MASLAKRALPPDLPDARNRVSKSKPILSKHGADSKAVCSALHSAEAHRKAKAIERALNASQGPVEDNNAAPDASMDDLMSDTTDSVFGDSPADMATEEVTQAIQNTQEKTVSPKETSKTDGPRSSASLMKAIKGLLDLTNDYLQDLEKDHPGVGSDFLALLADGASRAMRGQRVYECGKDLSKSPPKTANPSWADRAACEDPNRKEFSIKRQIKKASPPQGQSKEDRRVMIRLGPDHEARKTGTFELRQAIQKLVPDSSLVSDVWSVPSGVAILAPTPAKAAAILQAKTVIEERFGNATVERQETWTTFVIGPIQKKVRCLDGLRDPMDGLLLEELASVREAVPIRYMNWTKRSQNDEPYGYIRICVPELKAARFPSRLRVFGEAVSVRRIKNRQQILVCEKCHGFHATRSCARPTKCQVCGMDAHSGACEKSPMCLNCRGPHSSTDTSCPARPRRINGVLVRPTGPQLKHIRTAGRRETARANCQQPNEASPPASGNAGTENTTPLNY